MQKTKLLNAIDRRSALAAGVGLAIGSLDRTRRLAADDLTGDAEADLSNASLQDASQTGSDAGITTDSPESSIGSVVLPQPSVETWRFGIELTTPVACSDVIATLVIPKSWPEQTVETLSQTIDGGARVQLRNAANDCAQQAIVTIPRVAAGSKTTVSADMQITKHNLGLPAQTDQLVIPDRIPSEMRMFMGNSPNINASHGLIKKAWREIESAPHSNAWDRVEQIYDYVLRKVTYVEGPIRNASDALEDGRGDCEDMTGLFVALCRNARVPARMVWIPGHCYPEFYLQDPTGAGAWYPCQPAGTRQFGEMQETRPILQKGDRFRVPESRSQVRYLAQTFTCQVAGKGDPRPSFVMEKVS